MNKQNKKNNPKSAVIALAVVILISVLNAAIEDGGEGLGALVAVIIVAAAVLVAVKKGKKTRKAEQSTAEKVYTAKRPTVPDSCGYDDINCDYSHDYESRIKQLDGFLQNGTIDRTEYNVLREKYRKNYEEHKD